MRVQVGTVVSGVGVLGAVAWVARWATDLDPLLWVGAALLSVVAVAAGAGMVKPVPLRVVVGVCLALLCWSLGAVTGLDGAPVRAGVAGVVLLVVIPGAWERVRPPGLGTAPGPGGPRAAGGPPPRSARAATPAEQAAVPPAGRPPRGWECPGAVRCSLVLTPAPSGVDLPSSPGGACEP